MGIRGTCFLLFFQISLSFSLVPFVFSAETGHDTDYLISDLPGADLSTTQSPEKLQYYGYIVEFQDEPAAVRKASIESQIADKEKEIDLETNQQRRLQKTQEVSALRENLQSDVLTQKVLLKRKHADFIAGLKTKLGRPVTGNMIAFSAANNQPIKPVKILGEFLNVFNGLALDITAGEVDQIKSMPGVKQVYENLIVNISLMDSVPLINADDVWDMQDSSGLNITGQNVTIALIDTGVDYTHPDLGGCFGSVIDEKYNESFEDDLGVWAADYYLRCEHDKPPCWPLEWNITRSTKQAYDGIYSLKSYLNGDHDDGQIWVERTFEIPANSNISVEISFYLWSEMASGVNRWPIIAYIGLRDPEVEEDFKIIGETDEVAGWKKYSYSTNLETGSSGLLWIAFGFGVTWEINRTYYMDFANVEINQECKVIGGYDFVNYDEDPIDDMGHGTHVAGIAAGSGEGGLKGVAPDAKILAYKVLNSRGSGSFDAVIAGIERAVDPNQDGDFSDHADIISMSLGANCGGYYDQYCGPDDPVSQAVDNAVDAGIVSVIAAGNSGPNLNTIGSPGTARKSITVGATYKKDYNGGYGLDTNPKTDQIAWFSSRGPVKIEEETIYKPDVVAPGAIICSAQWDSAWDEYKCYDDKHVEISGTSMATPHVAGAVALIKQAHPDWTPEEIKATLKNTAEKLTYPSGSRYYDIYTQGAGRINVEDVVLSTPLISNIENKMKAAGLSLDIIGTAIGQKFKEYELYYTTKKSFDNPYVTNWTKIYNSVSSVDNGLLYNWDIGHLNGEYILKLVVLDLDDKKSESYSTIKILNTKIIYPINLYEYSLLSSKDKVVFRSDEPIEMKGNVISKGFQNYFLEWCNLNYECSTEGIELSNGGTVSIINETLGIWRIPAGITNGYYYIRLYNNGEKIYNDTIKIYIETELQKGWPQKVDVISAGGGFRVSFMRQPTLEDVNNDGKKEVLVAYGNNIKVYDSEGRFIPGFPVNVTSGCNMQQGPAVGDVNNDGNKEIVIGDNCGYINIIKNNGISMEGWPKNYGCNYIETVSLSDLNNDSKMEMLFGDWCGRYNIIDYSGNYLPGWPKNMLHEPGFDSFNLVDEPINIADLNNDGNKEIIAAGRSQNASHSSSISIAVFDVFGNLLDGWPKYYKGVSQLNPFILDLNKDGNRDIVFNDANKIYALDYSGNNLPGWPLDFGIDRISQIIPGDIDNDGKAELIFGFNNKSDYQDCLFAIQDDKRIKNGFPVCNIGGVYFGWLQAGNLIGTTNQVTIARASFSSAIGILPTTLIVNSDGAVPSNFPKGMDGYMIGESVPIGDLDNDGDNEMIVYTSNGLLFVWSIGGKKINDEWPVFNHDSQHTGCYDCNKTYTPITPAIKIIYPENKTYKAVTALNYTISGETMQSCWYSTNGGIKNNTIICGVNKTGLASAEGNNTWMVGAKTNNGRIYSAYVTFIKDSKPPKYSNMLAMPSSPLTYSPSQAYYFNISWEDSLSEIESVWLNFGGKNYVMSRNGNEFYKVFSSLTAGKYNYYFAANDSVGNKNQTKTFVYNITKASSQTSLMFDKTSPQTYGTKVNASCSRVTGVGNPKLYRNSSKDVTSTENNKLITLPAGIHTYNCSLATTTNYTASFNASNFTII